MNAIFVCRHFTDEIDSISFHSSKISRKSLAIYFFDLFRNLLFISTKGFAPTAAYEKYCEHHKKLR